METDRGERLERAVATLDGLIELARSLDLRDSAQFLAMARLNLLIDLNGITDHEFRSFCGALEGAADGQRRAAPLPRSARRRRSEPVPGEGSALGKAWRGADVAARHASRTRVKR
jgi:hypothetical protein